MKVAYPHPKIHPSVIPVPGRGRWESEPWAGLSTAPGTEVVLGSVWCLSSVLIKDLSMKESQPPLFPRLAPGAGIGLEEHLGLMSQLGAVQESMLPALIALCSSFSFLF